MPIDAATALADLDRLIETIGTVQTEDAAQPSQTRQKPIDFGRFGRCLDDADMPSSNRKSIEREREFGFWTIWTTKIRKRLYGYRSR